MKKAKNKIWRIVKKGLGLFFLTIGVAGLIIPIVPGLLLIFLGLTFLENEKITNYLWSLIKNPLRRKS